MIAATYRRHQLPMANVMSGRRYTRGRSRRIQPLGGKLHGQPARDLPGASEVIALRPLDAELEEHRQLLCGFDPFRDDLAANLRCDSEHAGNHCTLHWILVNVADQEDVELDDLREQANDVLEACKPGSGIVDRESHSVLPQPVDGALERLVVLDRCM